MPMNEVVPSVNRLIHEQSPYLLQHAHNPVDWYPWGREAFERAGQEDKPIFLSIGYSTCHWCHVMAHESFEDPEVAALLNQGFISIKVDREERPDIDQVYMAVCQMMTGHGGWPLTIVMTPERKPFFAATYLPSHTREGMPGLLDILPQLREVWKTRSGNIEEFTKEVIDALQAEESTPSNGDPSPHLLERAYKALAREYDPLYGGFGTSPKFPSPHQLLFLLRIWYRGKDPHVLSMVEKTLREMRRGGIFDHVGCGFHRYSVDQRWTVPHFEKMLYDQALLAIAYLETYQATQDAQYACTAKEIFTYVLKDLTAENGGFYAAEDADSEGVEGKYYLWTWQELEAVLESEDLMLISQVYSLKKEGNLPVPIHGAPRNANIFYQERTDEEIACESGISVDELRTRKEKVRSLLQTIRSDRARPKKDTKILADWNGLMIAALAFGGRVLDDAQYTRAAVRASEVILGAMRREDGRLNHAYTVNEEYIDAFSADYGAMAWGEIELFETTLHPDHLKNAVDLMDQLVGWYRDTGTGGYYFTPSDGESLILRKKESYDGAIPSSNALALYNGIRLASLTGKSEYDQRGIEDWRAFSTSVQAAPQAFTFLLISADLLVGPTQEVVITGDPTDSNKQKMIRALASKYFPRLTFLSLSGGESDALLEDLSPFIRSYTAGGPKPIAYVCSGHRCMAPTTGIEEMIANISSSK
jgi:uncharacterized protein YyaL (SSP411 family)